MLYARVKRVPLTARARWETIWSSTKEASWSIGTIVVIFGGIYGGVFTPTEAAGVAVIYSLFVTMVVHREVGFRDLWRIIQSAVFLISQILMIVTVAGLYSWLLTTSGCRRPSSPMSRRCTCRPGRCCCRSTSSC